MHSTSGSDVRLLLHVTVYVQQSVVVSSVSHKHKSSTKTSRDLQPLASTDKADERIRLESRRKLEKFVEIERYLRAEVERRKARMFRQQRHHVKVGETCNCPHVLVSIDANITATSLLRFKRLHLSLHAEIEMIIYFDVYIYAG